MISLLFICLSWIYMTSLLITLRLNTKYFLCIILVSYLSYFPFLNWKITIHNNWYTKDKNYSCLGSPEVKFRFLTYHNTYHLYYLDINFKIKYKCSNINFPKQKSIVWTKIMFNNWYRNKNLEIKTLIFYSQFGIWTVQILWTKIRCANKMTYMH